MLTECVCGCQFAAAQSACPQCGRTVDEINAEKHSQAERENDTPAIVDVELPEPTTRTRTTASKKTNTAEPTEK